MSDKKVVFTLEGKEIEIRDKWVKEHMEKCPYFGPKTRNWLGSPMHYVFTPWGCGTGKEIKCNCGESQSLNDPEEMP